jgi:hypothetical protein
MTFAHELDRLIAKHTANAKHGDDFIEVLEALFKAADKVAQTADGFPLEGETRSEFAEWHRYLRHRPPAP